MQGRKYSIETIHYFELVSDYMFLPLRTMEEHVHMARAFLLHLLGAYLFTDGGANSVFEVVDPFSGLWRGTESQLGVGMSCLS